MINLPLIKTCDKYIFCYYGQATLRKCEANQQFNVKTGKCDLAKNVDCVENHCSIHPTNNELVYVPSAASCEKYYLCMGGKAKALTCAAGLYFSTKCNCCDRSENVQCLVEDNETHLKTNKEKRFFDKYSKQIHTPTLIGETNSISCPNKGIFVYQYIEDPEKYITCIDGKATLYACAAGYQFDDRQKRCINKDNEPDFNIEIHVTDLTNETELVQCPKFGAAILPHSQESKYVLCVNGNATIYDCPDDHYFDTEDNLCHSSLELQRKKKLSRYGAVVDEVAGIVCPKYATFTFPHAEREKFYLCLDGKTTVFTCAEGQYFDMKEHGCVMEPVEEIEDELDQIVETSDNITMEEFGKLNTTNTERLAVKCPPTGNTTLPHVLRNQYYICREGVAAVFTCPEGLLYEAKLKTCTQHFVNNEIYRPAMGSDAANIMCPKFGTFKFPHLNKTMYYLCIDGKTYILACDLNEIFDVDLNICREDETLLELSLENELVKENATQTLNAVATEIASNVICPKFGTIFYPHVKRNRYYVCIDGSAIGFVCPEGQYFDTKTNACQRSVNVTEENEEDAQLPMVLDEPINILCPSVGAMKFAHEEKHKFYLCVNGMASVLACANDSYFDVESGACRKTFTLVSSVNETTLETDSDAENTTLENVNATTVKCPLLGTFIYPHANRTQYYVCFDGKALLLSCPEGLFFDAKEKTCQIPQQSERVEIEAPKLIDEIVNIMCPDSGAYKYPHVEKYKFYLCINGMGSVMACPEGSLFDSGTGNCLRGQTTTENSTLEIDSNDNTKRTTETLETTNITCPEFGTFLYPHDEEENKYFICLDGNAIESTCDQGLIFEATKNVCVKDRSMEKKDIRCPPKGTEMFPHKESNKFYLCTKGVAIIQSCANGDYFDPEIKTCRGTLTLEETINVTCPLNETTKLSYLGDSNKFYLCREGKAFTLSCPVGLIFDSEKKTCQISEESETPKILDEIVNVICPSSGAHKYPHVEKYKFYLCINGMGSVMACPEGSVFDSETGNCQRRQATTLESIDIETTKDRNETNIEEELSLNRTVETFETNNINCPEFGTFLYPHEEKNKYFICLDGTAIVFTCAKGLLFDVSKNVCVEDPAVTNRDIKCPGQGTDMLPHKESNKFYVCIKGIAIIQSCAAGDFFDPETKTCRETITTQTSSQLMVDIKCPPKGTAKLPYVGDSNKFYLCIEGKVTIHSCAKGDYFDAATESCYEPPLSEVTSYSENTPTEAAFNNICPPVGTALIAHIDSNKFYQCVDGIATLQSCANGDYFDLETQTCMELSLNDICPPQGTFLIPHTETTKFYECINGIANVHSCDAGEFFDAATLTCRETSNTMKSNIKCPDVGTIVYPLPQKNLFYVCSDGKARAVYCAEGDVFDAEINACREVIKESTIGELKPIAKELHEKESKESEENSQHVLETNPSDEEPNAFTLDTEEANKNESKESDEVEAETNDDNISKKNFELKPEESEEHSQNLHESNKSDEKN